MQAEHATAMAFHRQVDFKPLHDEIVRTAVHGIAAEQVAMFPDRKLNGNGQDEVGNDLSKRVQGTRIRHHTGAASIRMHDKTGLMIRVECTTCDVPFFQLHRMVNKRDGSWLPCPRTSATCPTRDA